jgi:hypothetical protein
LPQPVKGQELLGERMERESPEVRAAWDGSFHAGGEGSLPRQTRDGTWFDFGWVLGHGQAQGRQIKDLAAFVIEPGLAGQGHAAALAARTTVERMHCDLVGLFDRLQGVAGMPRLAAGLAPGFTAPAARGRFG